MVGFKTSFERAFNRMVGGLFGWLTDQSDSDYRMNSEKALSYPPVWNCVSRISGAFVIMPLNVHREQGRAKSIQKNHSSYRLLRWRPNAYQTPAVFKQQMICHALMWGNYRAFVRREGLVPVELIPLMPDRTVSLLVGGMKYHMTVIEPDDRLSVWENIEQKPEKTVILADQDVYHIPGLGFDGVEGKSLISLARQSWGIGLDAERHLSRMQKKGYAGGLMLEAPAGILREEGSAKEFLDNFRKNYAGVDNAGTVALLREGITAKVMTMNHTDAQFIEQRRFQREDAALWFVIQSIIGDNSDSYASIEQKNLAYRTDCLAPWTTKIEEECDVKLLTQSERNRGFYHKFNDGALLRTEKAQTMAFISQGIAARVISPNEGREMLDMNPYDGGDTYENPAITPGRSENQESGDSEQQTPEQARFSHLIGVEAGKVVNAARQAVEKGKNFVAWIDNFYSENWLQKLSFWLKEIGIDEAIAKEHCEQSKQLLLTVCDDSQTDTLIVNVEKCVEKWKERVKILRKCENV